MQETMTTEMPWKHEIEVATLPPGGENVVLLPDAATLARLAEFAGVNEIKSLEVRVSVLPAGTDGADVTGELTGVVRQTCGVSLEDFDNPIREAIDVSFAPDPGADLAEDEGEEDLPDPIIDGKIDLGALASEFLVLAVDPFPRKPGTTFSNSVTEAPGSEEKGPFAELAALKKQSRKV